MPRCLHSGCSVRRGGTLGRCASGLLPRIVCRSRGTTPGGRAILPFPAGSSCSVLCPSGSLRFRLWTPLPLLPASSLGTSCRDVLPFRTSCRTSACVSWGTGTLRGLVLRQLHELIQADFAKNHLKALKCFVEVDLLKCDRLLSQL